MVDICSSDPAIRGHIHSALVSCLDKTALPQPSSLSGTWMDAVHDHLPEYHMLQLPLPPAAAAQAQAAGASSDFLLNLVTACCTACEADPSRKDALQRQAVGERFWPLFTTYKGSRTDSGRIYLGVGALLETALSGPEAAEAECPTRRYHGRHAPGGPSLARFAAEKRAAEDALVTRLEGNAAPFAHSELPALPHHRLSARHSHDFVGFTREFDGAGGGILPVPAVLRSFTCATAAGAGQQPPALARLTFSRAYTSFFCPNADAFYENGLAYSYYPLWHVHEVLGGSEVSALPLPCTAPEGLGQCDARAAAIALRLGTASRAGIEPVPDAEALGPALTAKLDAAKAAAEAGSARVSLRGLALCQGHTYHGGLLMQHGWRRVEEGSRLLSRFPAATPPEEGDGARSLRRLCLFPEQLVQQAMVMEGGDGGGHALPPAALSGRHVLAALLLPPRLAEMCDGELGGQLCKAALVHNGRRFGTEEQLLSLRAANLKGHSLLGQICRSNQAGLLWWLLGNTLRTVDRGKALAALQHSGQCIRDGEVGKVSQWNTVLATLPAGNGWLAAVQQWRDDEEAGRLDKALQPTAFEYALCRDSLETAAVIAFAVESPPSLLDCYDDTLPNLVHKYSAPAAWPRDCFPVLPYDCDMPTSGGADAAGTGMGEEYFRVNAGRVWERLEAFLERLANALGTSAHKMIEGVPWYNRSRLFVKGLGYEAAQGAALQDLFATAAGVEPGDAPTLIMRFPGTAGNANWSCSVEYSTPAAAARARWATANKFRFGARRPIYVALALARNPPPGGGGRGGRGRGGGRGGGGRGGGGH